MTTKTFHICIHLIVVLITSVCIFFVLSLVAKADQMKINIPPSRWCDSGIFILGNGEVFTYEDMVLEGNRVTDWNAFGKVTVYGYMTEALMPSDRNSRTEAHISEGEACYPNFVSVDRRVNIDVIVVPSERTEDEYREIRRLFYRAGNGVYSEALVRLTGQFGIYRGTSEPFFLIDQVQIVDSP